MKLQITLLPKTATLLLLAISLSALTGLTACNSNLGPGPSSVLSANQFADAVGATTPALITYETVKKAIFDTQCLKCHSTEKAKGDIDLEQYKTAFAAIKEIREQVETDEMPRKAPPLSPEMKAMLFSWIDAGAPEK